MDKMALSENLLNLLYKTNNVNPLIKIALWNFDNITVSEGNQLAFVGMLIFNLEGIEESSSLVIPRVGQLLSGVYCNSIHPNIETEMEYISPVLYSIIKKCLNGSYDTLQQVIDSFRTTLMHTSFSDINNENEKRNNKDQKKGGKKALVIIFVLLLLAALGFKYFLQ